MFFFFVFVVNVVFCGTAMLVLNSYLERFRVKGSGGVHALLATVFWIGFAVAVVAELFILGIVDWQAINVLLAGHFVIPTLQIF